MQSAMDLSPMTDDEFDRWRAGQVDLEAPWLVSIGVDEDEAARRAEENLAKVLPEGPRTPDHQLLTARVDDRVVGCAWLAVDRSPQGVAGTLRQFALAEGHSRMDLHTFLRAVEKAAELEGATSIAFEVEAAAAPEVLAVGYLATMVTLSKRIDLSPPVEFEGVPALTLRKMTDEQYADLVTDLRRTELDDLRRSGVLRPGAEDARPESPLDRLPQGKDTPGQNFLMGYDGDEPVARLWVTLRKNAEGLDGYSNYMDVVSTRRGQAYGKAMGAAANALYREKGVREIRFRMFAANTPARALAASLGYHEDRLLMRKDLADATAG